MSRSTVPTADINPPDAPSPVDRLVRVAIGRATMGLSPAALQLAYLDWALHLASAPGKQAQLANKVLRKAARLGLYAGQCHRDDAQRCIEPLPNDRRFDAPEWQQWPFNVIHQSFLLTQQWWHNATTGVRGVTPHHEEVVNFVGRQMLDVFSPSNYLATNPELLRQTMEEGGANLIRGAGHLGEDIQRMLSGAPPAGAEAYQPGETVAVTPGKVIYRNRLMELIQYEPATKTVHPEPILVVPAWIMKYYILDLSPGNSLIRYLVEQGYTVFAISWKNPDAADRDLSFDDYRRLGVMAALETVNAVVPDQRVHGVGYCLGGTLLMIAAAAMARQRDERLATVTLFAAQADFREPGELGLFIDDSQVTFLDDIMWETGHLDGKQMAGAFQLLRSQDLVWSALVNQYLRGERMPMNDLMAWNADATRMPYRMHSEYLQRLYLDNEFADGLFEVDGDVVHLADVDAPFFVVGTERDHVAPWTSVYKINRLARSPVTFLLTNGGHNAGIVSPPEHPRRRYRVNTHQPDELLMHAEAFQQQIPVQEGSWWPEWREWLRARSGARRKPPGLGAPDQGIVPLGDAPGQYVFLK
ncbi:PHA/PHB synthase family protein [Aquisalimonas asiatica]|uniref:Polyhydroxyalkanoate synthase n=1 Tax=Aquisalimonas asiatica TaxID=406100 RepID=A0A1H8ULI1_9GAMM|nr:alpha/beta fold hydrolase [Aquisalimonas asiatica]SEP04055.1 polyhydroxyalkanoate synthase [Aquisalimonas asiatica]